MRLMEQHEGGYAGTRPRSSAAFYPFSATAKIKNSITPALAGVSLVEMVGVMAVIAVLAAVLIPVAVRRTDKAVMDKEVAYLGSISNALVSQLQRSNSIPDETSWSNVLANWTIRSSSQLAVNDRKLARRFFYDGSGWLQGNVPFAETTNGTGATVPTNLRIAIVSTIANALPNVNGSLSAADFNSIWNDLPYRTPSYLTSQGWTGNSYDLAIQRVTLDPLFHHLILINRDASTAPAFSINNSTNSAATVSVPNNATGWNSYYADGTMVGLWVGNVLTNRFVLTGDISFAFDGGIWRAQLTGGGQDNSSIATNFSTQATLFIGTANVPGGHQGSDTQGLLSAFYNFMYAYTIWANECPHFQSSASSQNQQVDYQILSSLGDNNQIIDSTSASTGGGLLK
jgi:type II secretory pathway pseudopilin PulG